MNKSKSFPASGSRWPNTSAGWRNLHLPRFLIGKVRGGEQQRAAMLWCNALLFPFFPLYFNIPQPWADLYAGARPGRSRCRCSSSVCIGNGTDRSPDSDARTQIPSDRQLLASQDHGVWLCGLVQDNHAMVWGEIRNVGTRRALSEGRESCACPWFCIPLWNI